MADRSELPRSQLRIIEQSTNRQFLKAIFSDFRWTVNAFNNSECVPSSSLISADSMHLPRRLIVSQSFGFRTSEWSSWSTLVHSKQRRCLIPNKINDEPILYRTTRPYPYSPCSSIVRSLFFCLFFEIKCYLIVNPPLSWVLSKFEVQSLSLRLV